MLIIICPTAVNLFALTMIDPELDGSVAALIQRLTSPGGAAALVREAFPAPTPRAVAFLAGLLLLQILLLVVVPGQRFHGPRAPSGHVPQYTDNGFACFFITLATLAIACTSLGDTVFPLTLIYDELLPILSTLNAGALAISVCLCFKGLNYPSTRDSGSTGSTIMDLYWGTELYPRILGIDLKQALVARYGIMLWALFALSFAFKSAELQNKSDGLPFGQSVSCALQVVYIGKFYYWERWYMHAADIQVDRYGFMMCWGPLCFMPLVHTLQNLYLVGHVGLQMSPGLAATYLVLGNTMTLLNYDADTQRHRIRAASGKCIVWGKPAKVIRASFTTADGKRHSAILSACGYQALSRHFHYLPDIINLFLYCSPAGFTRVLPFLYFIYLTSLLVDRTYRIDARCHAKYGKDWERYVALVKHRLIPGVW